MDNRLKASMQKNWCDLWEHHELPLLYRAAYSGVLGQRKNVNGGAITLPILMDKRKVNEQRLNDLLTMLGLQDRKKHLPNQLSGGQQQRVAIGRALMNAPAVMLGDEPTGALDSKNSREIIELLKESHERFHQTLILVTHDESIALQADRIITIADGKVVRDERRVARA